MKSEEETCNMMGKDSKMRNMGFPSQAFLHFMNSCLMLKNYNEQKLRINLDNSSVRKKITVASIFDKE